MLEFRKDLFANERDDNLNEVGKPTQRQDMVGHVTGRTPFFDDHKLDGMLHLKCVRSPHHSARIRSIDTSAAERSPGVRRILGGADVPVNLNTLLSLLEFGEDDEPSLATDQVRYKGEPVVAIIADSEREAWEAVAKVRVAYDPLPAVFDVEEALKPGAPSVNPVYTRNTFLYHEKFDHVKLRFGDVERAFQEADFVLDERYQMSPIEQAPIETNGAIAAPEVNDRYVVYTCAQGLFFSLDTTAKILDVPSNKLHFVGGTVGGGFGGKVDSLCEPLAVLGAMMTGRPVRYVLNRIEEMQVSAPRGAERHYIKDGVMRDGRIIARQFTSYFDCGAYTRLTSYGALKCTAHLPGPYTIPNVSANVYCVFTNRIPATAMRGFGVTGIDFAIECQMDKLAHLIGMDPMEFRVVNAYRDGDVKAHREYASNTALIECVQVAAEKAGWPLSDAARAQSSLTGGGGERAAIPETPLDDGSTRPAGWRSTDIPVQPTRGAVPPGPTPQPSTPRPPPIAAPQPAPRPRPAIPEPAAAPEPAPPPPTSTPPQQQSQPRYAGTRFSTVFGTRRR